MSQGESAGRARLIAQVTEIQDGCDLAARRMRVNTGNVLLDAQRAGMAEAYFDIGKRLAEALAGQEEEAPQPRNCSCWTDVRNFVHINESCPEHGAAKAEEDAPAPPHYPEESLATRILQEQKDLEAQTRAVTDVDRLVQVRDSLLKEPQP